jgi:hypothetical protein
LHAAPDWHDCPSQQGCPGAPQIKHVLTLQTRPAWQRRPAQHISPAAPHGAGGVSGAPTSDMGCVPSLALSRGASCTTSGWTTSDWATSGCVESGRAVSPVVSNLVSFADAVSFDA